MKNRLHFSCIWIFCLAAGTLLLSACQNSDKADSGALTDSGTNPVQDAGRDDSGTMSPVDSGTRMDSGVMDSGVMDSGVMDSGEPGFDYITDAGGLDCPYGGEAYEDNSLKRIQAESLDGTVGIASGNSWLLWAEGKVGTTIILDEAGEYTFRVRLWEEHAGDTLANAIIKMGPFTETVGIAGTVTAPTVLEYRYHLPAGSYIFEVEFTNDFNDGEGADRNLRVDYFDVETIRLCLDELPGDMDDAGTVVYQQLRNLPATTTARFETRDLEWPSTAGYVVVSQWKDDKMAAFSITIDDNVSPDHQYWLDLGTHYDWKWTWFVITGLLDGQRGVSSAYFSTTEEIVALYDAGHDIQSHSVTHFDHEELTLTQEYADSQAALAAMLPTSRQLTFAYPYGWNRTDPTKKGYRNDGAVASQYYIAARGTQGLVENSEKMDFMDIHEVSNLQNFFEAQDHWGSFIGMTDPYNSLKGRGWYVALFHDLNDDLKVDVSAALDYVKAHEEDIWVATFTEAAQYAQEFATAEVTNKSSAAESFSFELHDQMDDVLFDYPLTLKVRLGEDWANFSATQGQSSIEGQVVEHAGIKYALIHAQPDKGLITVTKSN